jgi:hypothetical protein
VATTVETEKKNKRKRKQNKGNITIENKSQKALVRRGLLVFCC